MQSKSSTTYTSKAGNLWVWTLGSQEDVWVRQRDRHRCFLAESDTAGVETVDVNSPVGPWFRLGEALGLKGQVALVSSGAMHILLHDGERVHLFAPEDDFLKLPTTVVPALLDDEVDAVDAILAVVEASTDIAALHGAVEDRLAALNEEAWTGSREQADLTGALNHPDEKPGQVVYTYEPPEPHPAIARIDAILDRALADLEPRPEDAPGQRRTNRDLADLGRLIRALTTARRELKR